VLTGDNERTATHVCREVGLPVKGAVRGAELTALDDDELGRLVARTTIFARVNPEQKLRWSRPLSATATTSRFSATV